MTTKGKKCCICSEKLSASERWFNFNNVAIYFMHIKDCSRKFDEIYEIAKKSCKRDRLIPRIDSLLDECL
jgi:hypothetical protein